MPLVELRKGSGRGRGRGTGLRKRGSPGEWDPEAMEKSRNRGGHLMPLLGIVASSGILHGNPKCSPEPTGGNAHHLSPRPGLPHTPSLSEAQTPAAPATPPMPALNGQTIPFGLFISQ